MTAEDSVAEFRRERGNVRSYVRSSSHKLKWTRELHQTFMRAVARLGGKDSKFCCTSFLFSALKILEPLVS